MIISRSACALVLLVSGCASTVEDSYFDTGAGLSLHTAGTSAATKDLQNYYSELCRQANPLSGSNAVVGPGCASPDILVRTGFNDIDLRCDRYLAWIDRKRLESSTFKSGVAATSALVAGFGSGGTIRDVALALGFATSIYDSYNNALLNGLESSTIKKIIYERRRAYRREFLKVNYTSYADTTYALRGYLRICTPQTIVLSANEYAVAGLTNTPVASPERIAREEMETLAARPLQATTAANVERSRPPLPECPQRSEIFVPTTFTCTDVRQAQRLLCQSVDGEPGPNTLAALAEYDAQFGTTKDGKITNLDEWRRLQGNGCLSADPGSGFRSIFERNKLANPAVRRGVIGDINETLGLSGDAAIPADADPTSQKFREGIEAARAKLGVDDPNIRDPQEYSFKLDNAF